ncbi:MAG: hypothetical protein ACXWED_01895, partial [Solirubrobacterales bacterium]
MSSTQSVGRLGKHASSFAISGLLAAVGMLIMASVAMAGPDPLKGGATTFNLKLPKKVKIKSPGGGASLTGTALELPITGGSLDPTNGAGAVEDGGTFVLKKGKKKVTVSVVKPTFGGPYGGGSLSADLATPKKKKKKSASTAAVKTLADLTGGTLSRVGFGARVASANAVLTKGGAKALNKALGLKKKKKNGKKNKNRFKKGNSLADVSTTTIPLTVEVIGGTAITHGSTGFGKLAYQCTGTPAAGCYGKGVNPIPGTGVTASGGASYTTPGGAITSPVVAPSAIAPDASAGSVKTGGTVQIKKTVTAAAYGGLCPQDAAHFPVGDFIQFSNTTNEFLNKNVLVDLTLQAPFLGFPAAAFFGSQIPSGHIDMAGASINSDANAHTINVDGFAVRNENSAQIGLINGTFGVGAVGCGISATDAAIGDALFTVDL